MERLNQQGFILFLDGLRTTTTAHNLAVDFGGNGKVVVLRWSLLGSNERTEKKVLFASQSPVMVKAAYNAFTEWLDVYQSI